MNKLTSVEPHILEYAAQDKQHKEFLESYLMIDVPSIGNYGKKF